jgi:hypothetical protein
MIVVASLVCKRWFAVANEPVLWLTADLRGPVSSLSWREQRAFERRNVVEALVGAAASPLACGALLSACIDTLKSVTIETPENTYFDASCGALAAVLMKAPHLIALHFLASEPSPADQPNFWQELDMEAHEWQGATEPLLDLLRLHKIAALSLCNTFVPPSVVRELGAACGDSLKSFSFFPANNAQCEAFCEGGADELSGLTTLECPWLLAPRLLQALLPSTAPGACLHLDLELRRSFWNEVDIWAAPLLETRHPAFFEQLADADGVLGLPADLEAEETDEQRAQRAREMDSALVAIAQAAADHETSLKLAAALPEELIALSLVLRSAEWQRLSPAALHCARAVFPRLLVGPLVVPKADHAGECNAGCVHRCAAKVDWATLTCR